MFTPALMSIAGVPVIPTSVEIVLCTLAAGTDEPPFKINDFCHKGEPAVSASKAYTVSCSVAT